MGLIVDLYRSSYDSTANTFHGKQRVTVVNVEGPFEPTPDAPAAELSRNAFGDPIIVPVEQPANAAGPMMGGTYAATSDSRWSKAAGYAALPVHDRFETWQEYASQVRD